MKISFTLNNDDYSKFIDFTFKEAGKEEKAKKNRRCFRIIQYFFPSIIFIYLLSAYTLYDTHKFLLILFKSVTLYAGWVLVFEGIYKMDYYITKKRNLKNFEKSLINTGDESNKKHSLTLELKDDRLICGNSVSISEISYAIINKVHVSNEFILINYYTNNSILIPIRAFKNQNEKELFLKMLKELREKNNDELLALNEVNNPKLKLEYCGTEEELNKISALLYELSSKVKKQFKILNISQIVVALIILGLIGLKNIVFIVFIVIYHLKVGYPKLKNKIMKTYKNTLKKQLRNHNKTLLITDEYLISANSEIITHYKKSFHMEILELEEFLIGKKDGEFIFNIPHRVFKDKEEKQKFLKLLNE